MGMAFPLEGLPRGERGGEPSRAQSEASLDGDGGDAPSLHVPQKQPAGRGLDYHKAHMTPKPLTVRKKLLERRVLMKDAIRLATGEHGGIDGNTVNADFAWKCDTPVRVESFARNDVLADGSVTQAERLNVDRDVPCRKCAGCLRHRASLWKWRATRELATAQRTWFATWTLRPEVHVLFRYRAIQRLADTQVSFDTLSEIEQWREQQSEGSRELTLMLKRLRRAGARIRYLIVAEAHKSGLPHWHGLLHEAPASLPVLKRELESAWPHGFCRFTLVKGSDRASAGYVTKYLSKSMLCRVRGSIRYGRPPQEVGDPRGSRENMPPPHKPVGRLDFSPLE